ncbi:hypothetical protein L1049_004933 [Liquidambar formosana]|uniref:Btz domain-containing protein n=1 Tax=Liquidambar formosana TaxID=63359 RepID=A0AAP0WX49_LIQFO
MAAVGEEETEYESDPEEAKLSLAMRRREASDDEEEGGRREEGPRRIDSRVGIGSDEESDGQGGAAEYDDEELEVEDEEEEIEDEVEDEGVEEEEEVDVVGEDEEGYEEKGGEGVGEGGGGGAVEAVVVKEAEGERRGSVGEAEAEDVRDGDQVEEEEEEEKKENEPFAVPTAGAFYMHDDRFRDNAGGRHRRTPGGRKLWESKDDRKWGHDKFEEMTLQERHYEEGRRNSKNNYRGRGKNRGMDRGYVRGNRSKAYNNNNNNNQNQAPKGVRGRGSRRYEPPAKNRNEILPAQTKQSGKSLEKNSHTSSGRAFAPTSNIASDPVPARKNGFGSSLSSASPPFYPSGSSNKDSALTQKRDVQVGNANKNLRPSVIDESFSMPQSNALLRGKNIVDSVGMDKLYIDDSISQAAGKPSTNLQLPPSGSSFINTVQIPQSRAQGRGLGFSGQMPFQTTPPHNQVNRVSPTPQIHAVQRSPPVQSRVQPSLQASSAQPLGQRLGNGSQASSPPKAALSIKSFESGEMESPPESSKSKTALVGKGKGSVQGSGRGSFLYNGAQVMGATGNMGGGHGDQNFPGTPAFLPVMQFGGQHPGGIGVPAVGMAFPGYVAQPQLGLGNSEMTWLPVLAGAAGALGATYCSPYFPVDGSYHARPSGQTSSTGSSSKENNTSKPSNEWKPSQRPELVGEEFGQRQNKPRRYSEMNFGQ